VSDKHEGVGLTLKGGSVGPLPRAIIHLEAADPGAEAVVGVDLITHPDHEVSEGLLDGVRVGQRQPGPAVGLTACRRLGPRLLDAVESLTAFQLSAVVFVRVTTDRPVVTTVYRTVDRRHQQQPDCMHAFTQSIASYNSCNNSTAQNRLRTQTISSRGYDMNAIQHNHKYYYDPTCVPHVDFKVLSEDLINTLPGGKLIQHHCHRPVRKFNFYILTG